MKIKEHVAMVLLSLSVLVHLAYVVGCGSSPHRSHRQPPATYRDCDGRLHRLPIYQHDPTAKRGERTA